MKCPPGCRVAMTVMSRVKRHVVERKRVQLELEVKCTGAIVTVSQSRRRSSVTYLRGQAIRVYAVWWHPAVGADAWVASRAEDQALPAVERFAP
jgi:hypothetical protein